MTEDGATAVTQMLEAGVDLAGVNVMTMDYGSSRADGDIQADASIKALTSAHRQIRGLYARAGTELTDATVWSKIGATPSRLPSSCSPGASSAPRCSPAVPRPAGFWPGRFSC